MIVSKAPLISKKRAITNLPLLGASLMSEIRYVVKSVVKRFRRALK